MGDAQEVESGTPNVGSDSASIRRQLRDSIYLWACGEKADDEDADPTVPDRLIGWLILLMQGFAYATLIMLAGSTPSSDADIGGESGYLLSSVTGAMYLLVSSTTHDMRAGFSLLVDGSCAGHRAFGLGLLTVYGIMITAAMTVLVSTSSDSASVVLNAVTVLFIADLDEKALKFLSTVPPKWRLFWVIESMGFSFVLALVAIFSIRDSAPLFEGKKSMLQTWPVWFMWVLNPVAVTISSFLLSSTLRVVCEFCREACFSVDEPSVGVVVRRAFVRFLAAMKRAKERVRGEPCFYVMLAMWLAPAVVNWLFVMRVVDFPVAFYFAPSAGGKYILNNKSVLIYTNVILATGLAAKAWGVFQPRYELATGVAGTQSRSNGGGPINLLRSCVDSRVPSLLVGWGIGYWTTSLIALLFCAWDGDRCGWNSAPRVFTLLACVVVPSFLIAGVFMMADENSLGTRVGAFLKPAVDCLRNRRRVEYWIMASVFRDFLVVWINLCRLLKLNYYA